MKLKIDNPFAFTTALLLSGVFIYIAPEHQGKAIFLIGLIWVWLFLGRALKSYTLASLLWLILILPFNITLGLPSLVEAYVSGVTVNYLVPIVSILDLGFGLVLLSALFEGKFSKLLKEIPWYILFIGIYLFFHNALFFSSTTLFMTARYVLYALSGYLGYLEVKNKRIRFLNYLVLLLFSSVLLQGLIGVFQFLISVDLNLTFLGESNLISGAIGTSTVAIAGQQFMRAYGTFPHPNVFSGYLLLSAVVGAYNLLRRKERGLLSFLLMAHSTFFVFFTMSRVAWILFIFLWVLVIMLWFKPKWSMNGIFFASIGERFTDLFSGTDYSVSDRINLLKSSWEVIKTNWFGGVGAGQFVKGMEGAVPTTTSGILLLQPVHNVYMLVLSEHGVIFGGALLASLAMVVYKKVQALMSTKAWIPLFALFAILFIGLFDHYPITLPQGLGLTYLFILLSSL